VRLVVRVEGAPTWAYVDVDGIRKGVTPLAVQVDAGEHSFVFQREGFRTETRQLTVRGGEDAKLLVELSR